MIHVLLGLLACSEPTPTPTSAPTPLEEVRVGVIDPETCPASDGQFSLLSAGEADDGALMGSRLVPPATPFEVTGIEYGAILQVEVPAIEEEPAHICDTADAQRIFLFITDADASFPDVEAPDHVEILPSVQVEQGSRFRELVFEPDITLEQDQVLWVMWELHVDGGRRSCAYTCQDEVVSGIDYFHGPNPDGFGWTELTPGVNLLVNMYGIVR